MAALHLATNGVNRAMGLRDVYPFILSPAAVGKLGFIHGLVRDAAKARKAQGDGGRP